MEKNKYFEIVNLYKKEKNLNRLVYRIIKHEDMDLSLEQIVNRISKILHNVNLPKLVEESFENAKAETNLKAIKMLEKEGYVEIEEKLGDIHFKNKNGKSFIARFSVTEEYEKVRKEIKEKYYKPVEDALKVVMEAKWIEKYEETKYYISPYDGKRKVKSVVERFRAKK